MKVKTFREERPYILANVINVWLNAHPEYAIKQISYAANEDWWSVLILYTEE